ncbi:tyrosine-type recombinase/integrase [Acidobacteria bacterium AH-259-L09]|nr:tyrosine-type recombinase/integrase [Acidobacteria bacterium AH-259-L09]
MFPFIEDLRGLLETQREYTRKAQRAGIICPFVFHRSGKQVRYFRRSWITACQKSGVPGRIPHDFRRTAVRNLVRAGVPERVAMQMTGHKTRSVFERYNIVSDADLEQAARRLEDYHRTVTVAVTVGDQNQWSNPACTPRIRV